MSARLDIDLETERINLDGTWMTREDLTQRIQQMLAGGDFKITRVSEALEQLAQAVSGVKTLTLKLSAEQYAKLESAGGRVGKTAPAFARELLVQVLGSAVAASSSATPVASPIVAVTPAPPPPPVVAAPPPVVSPLGMPPPVMTPVAVAATTSEVTPEEAAAAITIAPKRKGDSSPNVPPVMTPVAPPAVAAPISPSGTNNVVVDLSDDAKRSAGGPGEGRRWFNRS